MKHLKIFEDFEVYDDINEGKIKKFFTGHESQEAKVAAKQKLLNDIDNLTAKLAKDRDMSPEKLSTYREKLMHEADQDNWKGSVRYHKGFQPGGIGGRYQHPAVTYHSGKTGLQNIGGGSAAGIW